MTSYTSYSELFTVIISCNIQYSWSDGLRSESATLAPPLGLEILSKEDSPKGIFPIGIAMLYLKVCVVFAASNLQSSIFNFDLQSCRDSAVIQKRKTVETELVFKFAE